MFKPATIKKDFYKKKSFTSKHNAFNTNLLFLHFLKYFLNIFEAKHILD